MNRKVFSLLASILIMMPMHVVALNLPDPYTVASVPNASYQVGKPFLSADGRYAAFMSNSPNLTPDSNGKSNVYREDLTTGQITRIDTLGVNNQTYSSYAGSVFGLSADGSKVLFTSSAPLDPSVPSGQEGVYIRDMTNNSVVLVNACGSYCVAVFMSSDANIIIYATTDAAGNSTFYERNMTTGVTQVLSLPGQGSSSSTTPVTISGNGRYIVYYDNYPMFVGSSTYTQNDIRVYDLQTGMSAIVDVATDGGRANGARNENPSISDDGRYVSFFSYASNLVAGDTNGRADIFTRDMVSNTTEIDSVRSDGIQGNSDSMVSQISPDGRYVLIVTSAYLTDSTPIGDETYIHDRSNGITRLATPQGYLGLSTGAGYYGGRVSADDGYVVFGTFEALTMRNMNAIFTDNTPPQVTAVYTPQPTNSGWNNSPVQLSWNIHELDSLVTNKTGCDPVSVSSETSTHGLTFTCSVTSGGGTTTQSATIKYDATPPTITSAYATPPNASGWNNTDVTVTFSCLDQLSGIASCSGPRTFTNEGAGQWANGVAIDNAGNLTNSPNVPVNIDKTPPTGNISNTQSLVVKTLLNQTLSGNAGDGLSGVDSITLTAGTTTLSGSNGGIAVSCNTDRTSCTWSAVSSQLPSGINNFTLSVTDKAGNVYKTTTQYIVL